MNAVLGYTQILQRDTELSHKQRESLQIIERSGNHLLDLINDILDISNLPYALKKINAKTQRRKGRKEKTVFTQTRVDRISDSVACTEWYPY